MKVRIVGLIILLAITSAAVAQNEICGFGQVKIDTSGFSIPKVRIFLKGPVNLGILKIGVRYEVYADFNTTGLPQLGFANLIFKSQKDWLPEVIVGRTLDPVTYQFPAPFQIPVLNYPSACFNKSMGTGVFMRGSYNGLWIMAGITNGSGQFVDDNHSFDFTGRLEYILPFGFKMGGIFRTGKQPTGYRQIFGGDLTWKSGKFWVNGGQNILDYNGRQIGRWLWSTINLTKWLQAVGLIESLKIGDKNTIGWTVGINISLTSQTVIRVDYFKSTVENSHKSWGVLFQQIF